MPGTPASKGHCRNFNQHPCDDSSNTSRIYPFRLPLLTLENHIFAHHPAFDHLLQLKLLLGFYQGVAFATVISVQSSSVFFSIPYGGWM